MDKAAISPALGKVTSGIYIAAAVHEGRRIGMLSSFVEQASFDPPMISICIAHDRPMVAAMNGHGTFGLNVLGQHNHGIVKSFVKLQADPFEGHALVENRHNLPQFAEALAFLACKVTKKIETGDHWLYLAEVYDGIVQHEHDKPMFRIRRNGFDY
jgi:flavin reductase (DIM6/NTAB) family NADH-FMN oxidoreductase RutF